jgi:DNA mismatch repair protein MutS
LEGVRNLQVSVKEAGDRIIFLRKVAPGAASRSYGIEVARLAGLPMQVIERAREVLKIHERQEAVATAELTPQTGPLQIRLFEPSPAELVERLRRVNLDEMRPIDALRFLADLQKEFL